MIIGKRCRALLVLLLPLLVPTVSEGGAWTQPRGGYYFKLSGSYFSTSTMRDLDGNESALFADSENMRDGTFLDINLAAYGEYGLFSRLTLVGQLPVKFLRSKRIEELAEGGERDFNETTVGPGDLTLGVRYAHLLKPIAVSVQGNVKLPLGYDRSPEDGGPPLGGGEMDSDVRLLVGRSLYPLPVYLTGSGGYRRRGGVYSDEVFYEAEIGFSTPTWLVKAALNVVDNRGGEEEELSGNRSGLDDSLVGEQDYTKLIIGLERALDQTARFTIDIIDVIDGRNTIDGTTLSIGIAYSH